MYIVSSGNFTPIANASVGLVTAFGSIFPQALTIALPASLFSGYSPRTISQPTIGVSFSDLIIASIVDAGSAVEIAINGVETLLAALNWSMKITGRHPFGLL